MERMFKKITSQKKVIKKKSQGGLKLHQCMLSMYKNLSNMKETSNYTITNRRDDPSLRHKAADFKFQVLQLSDSVFSEITADPVLQCMLKRMKKVEYSREREEGTNCVGEEDVCGICLDAYHQSIGLDIRQMECGHIFHDQCVYKWFDSGQGTCPMCRFTLL
ncbi:hypothetical protein Sjap_024239 [Stephania japonica]|uniref:RING-type E3 ubiquitin transferase n=1 Tax=Stephania japonica TaxID=461633 RepID=A0AAP0HNI5_9MAGN